MDSIGNMLSQIRNASLVGKKTVQVGHSKMNFSILNLLKESNYLEAVSPCGQKSPAQRRLSVTLAYSSEGKPAITVLRRISTPGQRVYCDKKSLRHWYSGRGLRLISTSRGLMTLRQAAAKDLGGELICEVY